jgi:hypothetical protein
MSIIKGWFFVSLREVGKSDAATLEKSYACNRFKECCGYDPETPGSQFVAESESSIPYLYAQYMVLLAGRTIGTVYAYGHDPRDGHTFVSVYVENMYEWLGCGAEAVAILVDHLFRTIAKLREVRFEVYEHSVHSLQCLRGLGLKGRLVEGRSHPHRGGMSKLFLFSIPRSILRKYAVEASKRGINLEIGNMPSKLRGVA